MNIAEVLAALDPDRIKEELDDDLSFVLEDAWNKAARSVGSTASFDIQNPLVVEFLAENDIKAEGITRTLQERVGTQLIEGVMSGEGVDQIRRRVEEAWPDISENRAETIARTEITRAQSYGNVQAYEASGVVDGLEWSAALINTRPSHLVLNGQTRKLGEDFTSGLGNKAQYPGGFGSPGDDVNCVVGETVIRSAFPASKVFRRWYEGAIVEIVDSRGNKLAVTPNHPVLTEAGWVPAGDVCVGDSISCRVESEHVCVSGDYIEDTPPTAEKIYESAIEMRIARYACQGGDSDFHGDGFPSEVDIVFVEGELLGEESVVSALSEKFRKPLFSGPLPADGSFVEGGKGSHSLGAGCKSSDGGVGAAGKCGPLGRASLAHDDCERVSDPSCFNAGLSETSSQKLAGYAKFGGETLDALPASVPGTNLLDVVDVDAARVISPRGHPSRVDAPGFELLPKSLLVNADHLRDLADGTPLRMETSSVVDVRLGYFSGHVYNLQTDSGWYTANGVTLSNCMCAVIPTVIADSLDVDGKQRYRVDSETDKRRYQAEMKAAMKAVIDTFLPEILRRIR